ncbi:MAG: 50S ribosomal protein L18Ae [Candidatus Hodarchaeales archaeon]
MSKRKKPRKKAAPKQETTGQVVKVFLVEGSYREKKKPVPFAKEVRALRSEHVKEHIYRDLGSRHRLKMQSITISSITEIDPAKTEIRDPSVALLSSDEAKKLVIPAR